MSSIEEYFVPKLKSNESILWTGMPKTGFLMKDSDMILIPVSIIMIGFSIIFDYILVAYDAPPTYYFFGVMITVAAIYMAFFRLMLDAKRRRNTYYCVTNKRILLIHGKKRSKFHTLQLKDIPALDKTIEKDGSGFILFGTGNPVVPWLIGGFIGSGTTIQGFEFVPGVEEVFDKISGAIVSYVDPEIIEKIRPTEESLN